MIYLLDSNAWIGWLRHSQPALVHRIQAANPADICLCSVVLGELIYGALHSGPAHQSTNLAQIAALRQYFTSLPYDDRAAEVYGKLREDLSQRGLLIGPNDLLIAAIALANGLTIVTHNTAEFSRITGLLLEDWQIP